ncbi:MAG: LysR family transcriptional regulator [Sphingobium sp.]
MDPSTARQFDIFAQMVASGDMTICARDLGLPLRVIETELSALETRLGYQLFTQSFGTVSLTPAGRKAVSALELLANHASEDWDNAQVSEGPAPTRPAPADETGAVASEVADQAHNDISSVTPPPSDGNPAPVQSIVLASHPTIFAHFQEALTAFETTSPDVGITLRLEGLTSDQVKPLFDARKADIAYFYALEAPQDIKSRYAWSERISLFIADDHPLARAEAVLADGLLAVPYLALGADNMIRQLSEAALARAGLRCGQAQAESDNLYEIMTLVQKGQGYFASFGPMARDFGKMKNVRRIAYAQGLPQVEVRQAVRSDRENDAAISALAEYLFR